MAIKKKAEPAKKAIKAKTISKPKAVKNTLKKVAVNSASSKSGTKKDKALPKKSLKPVVKKAVKKTVAKPAPKKAVAKTAAKTPVKKASTKTASKPVTKKNVAKPAVKTTAKKLVPKPVTKKLVKKSETKPTIKTTTKGPVVMPMPNKQTQKPSAKPAEKSVSKNIVQKSVAKPAVNKVPAKKVKPQVLPKETNIKSVEQTKVVSKPTVRYSDSDLDLFHHRIIELKKEAMEELSMLKDRLDDLNSYDFAEESMIYSMHMAEQGSEAMEKEKTYAQIQRINEYLKKLDEALERIKQKTYGVCRVCNCLIAKERLMAVPITTLSASYKIHKKCPDDGVDRIEPLKH